MCRLFGFRSLEPTGVQHELLEAANALCVQSREHPDGWGLGWYAGGDPEVARALEPAHSDEDFAAVGQSVTSTTVVAHVRKASVGRIALENTHPFQWDRWLFVHNGTIPAWDAARPRLEEAIAPDLRALARGETDSERCFLLFLSRLQLRCDPLRADFASAAAALSETVALVKAACPAQADPPPSTTFLATDGQLMLACRSGRTLFLETVRQEADGRVAAVTIASERPCRCEGRNFREVPEGRIVGVDAELRVREALLSAGAAAA